jgi:hypothetical protein
MRIFTLAAIGALALGVAFAGSVSAMAQSEESDSAGGVVPEATTAPTTGTLELTFNITLKSSFPAGSVISCLAFAEAVTENTQTAAVRTWAETVIGTTKVSGSTATCTATIPYSWTLQPAGTGVVNYFAGIYDIFVLSESGKAILADRASTSLFAHKVNIPATGAITKYTVAVTI